MKTSRSEIRPRVDSRVLVIRWLIVCSIWFLVGGLFFFQIRNADRYVQLAMNNRLRVIRIPRVRGQIFDRQGRPLAVNVTVFDVMAYPVDLTEESKARFLEAVNRQGIPLSSEELSAGISRRFWAPYRAVAVVSGLTMTQMTSLLNDPSFPSGFFPLPRQRRDYPAGPLTAHVVGQVGEISEGELASSGGEYAGGDVIGKTGVEKYYETLLRGDPGERALQVDARGRPRGDLDKKDPVRGGDIHLTIDLAIQKKAAALMGDFRGAAIALDVKTGEVLAMYSSPSYDPNPLAWGISSAEWGPLQEDPRHPMINRAVSAQYSPGSCWKAFTGYAALECGAVTTKTQITCTGSYKLSNQTFRCWRRWGHGQEDIIRALRDSCDVFFYTTSQLVGIDRYLSLGRRLGLDGPLGIDLPGESRGNLAGPEWKKGKGLGAWFKGDTVNYSIGQGYLLLTPLQMVNLFATIANGGTVIQPHVNKDLKPLRRDPHLNGNCLSIIRKGLKAVVAPGGTGWRAGTWGVSVAGKTGTVQNSHGDDHAVFIGYAPADAPRYAVIYYLEAGKGGGKEAAPMVGQLLAFLLEQDEGTKENDRAKN